MIYVYCTVVKMIPAIRWKYRLDFKVKYKVIGNMFTHSVKATWQLGVVLSCLSRTGKKKQSNIFLLMWAISIYFLQQQSIKVRKKPSTVLTKEIRKTLRFLQLFKFNLKIHGKCLDGHIKRIPEIPNILVICIIHCAHH